LAFIVGLDPRKHLDESDYNLCCGNAFQTPCIIIKADHLSAFIANSIKIRERTWVERGCHRSLDCGARLTCLLSSSSKNKSRKKERKVTDEGRNSIWAFLAVDGRRAFTSLRFHRKSCCGTHHNLIASGVLHLNKTLSSWLISF